MATVQISEFEYNYLLNQLTACERALHVILEERGQIETTISNVLIYLSEPYGVGAFFVDEDGERLEDLDYAGMNNLRKA